MNIVPIVRFDLQFNAPELSRLIALLTLGRSQLQPGIGYNEATTMIENLEAALTKYEKYQSR